MDTRAGQQPAYDANGYGIIRDALNNAAYLNKFLPTLTDEGKRILQEAAITRPEQQLEFFQILNLAVFGAQQRNAATQQQQESAQQQLSQSTAYVILCKAANDSGLLSTLWPKLTDQGKQTLEQAGITDAGQREFLDVLNAEATGLQQQTAVAQQIQQLNQQTQLDLAKIQLHQQVEMASQGTKGFVETMDVAKSMRDGLKKTIKQIDDAFNYTMWMYIISFGIGLALIVAAIWFARLGRDHLLTTIVLGGLGTASTLTFFFTKPPERLQSSRASLAQLQIALLAWFNDFYNQNLLLGQLNFLQLQSGKLDETQLTKISQTIIDHTETMMTLLHDYCMLVENPENKANKKKPSTVRSKPKLEATAQTDSSTADAPPATE
jgi:hypothetical protein